MNQNEACNEAQKIAKQAINDYQDEWGIEGPDIGTYVVDCVAAGLLPLIEADARKDERERIATEIEAKHRKGRAAHRGGLVLDYFDVCRDCSYKDEDGYLITTVNWPCAGIEAARIARGADQLASDDQNVADHKRDLAEKYGWDHD